MKGKSTKFELAARLRVVQEWIMMDHTFTDIKNSAIAKWGISERQAERYYSAAYASFELEEIKNHEQLKAYHVNRRKKLLRDMDPAEKKTAAGTNAARGVLDSIAEIQGIKVNKHELSGKDGGAIVHAVSITLLSSGPAPAGSEKDVDLSQ